MNPDPKKRTGAAAGFAVWVASYMGWIPAVGTLELPEIGQAVFRQFAGIAPARLGQGTEIAAYLQAGLEIEVPAVSSNNGGQNVCHQRFLGRGCEVCSAPFPGSPVNWT